MAGIEMFLIYMFVIVGVSASELVPNLTYSALEVDSKTGNLYVGDGNTVKVYDPSFTKLIRAYELGPDLVKKHNQSSCVNAIYNTCDDEMENRITLLELFHKNDDIYVFACLKENNGTCFLIDTARNSTTYLEFDHFDIRYLVIHPIRGTNLDCTPARASRDEVYLCLGNDAGEYTNHKQRHVIVVLKILINKARIFLASPNTLKLKSTIISNIYYGFMYESNAYYVIKNIGNVFLDPNDLVILQVDISNLGNISFLETSIRCNELYQTLYNVTVATYLDKLILTTTTNSTDHPSLRLCSTPKQAIKEHFQMAQNDLDLQNKSARSRWFQDKELGEIINGGEGIHRSASVLEMNISPWQYGVPESRIDFLWVPGSYASVIGEYFDLDKALRIYWLVKINGIHRSASVLEMNISPWQYGVPETRIDAFVVGTRHGQVIAFYTYLTAGNTRVFYKMKLGSNSFKQKWAEIENFGKERVLDMWINGDKLVIATEKKIRSLDIARCQYEWVDDCARDVECTLCSGNVTGYCIRNAACSKPASVDKLVMFEIDKISPQEGCPQSIVRVQGLNLDLAENITVTIHGEPAHIISPLSGNRDIEIRIPALNETVTNTTLTVSINNIVIKTFPFSTISCPYITEHAGQLFKTIRRCNVHSPTAKRYTCEICGNTFVTRADVSAHLRRVHAECPFVCYTCDKSFATKQDLQDHEGAKRQICLCGKAYRYSGGTIIPFHVANYRTMDNSAFFTIEVAFLYNGSKVASARLHSVDKVNTNQPFAFYAPPLLDYVGQDLQLALAAPTYHLLDRDYGLPVLYGGVSNLTVKVYPDPVIIGVHDGDVNDVKKRVTYSYWDGGGKIFFAAKNLDAIQTSDVDITIEPLGKCTDVQIYRRANGRLSCELPWPKSVYRTARFDVIIKIGQNLIYHPGEIYFFKESRRTTRNAQNTTRHKTKTPNIRPNIHDTTVAISGTRSDVTGTSVRLEVIIPLVLLAVGILGCGGLLYCRFRKSRKRSPFRDTIDRDLPSVVSYRSNVGVFIGEPRPSFQGIQSEISSTDAFIPDNFEDSAQLIINSMEEEGLILKKRDLNIDRLIGRGNFGSVYKGYLLKGDDRIEIAVKTLQRDSPENMDITQFLKEAYVMKNFNHMNVMTLIGACLDAGDLPLVVLPYMKHGDLLTYLQEEEHIPTVKDLVCFGLDITLGMEYLASLKFVHRDLAARNCMLDVNYRVKVADFGLSRDIYETSYYSTKSKGIKLPVKWMAIESLAEGVFDEKTDVWSFGVTLWELMTRGVRPYAAVDNWDIEAYLTSGRRLPQPLFCPANLYKLMRKCWSHDPEDRPNFTIIKEWITELLDRVHHYLGDMEKTTDIENTYVNLSQGKKCKYENLNF